MDVRVLHCDDSDAFRLLVREMLRDEEGIAFVGEAADAGGVLRLARELDPDVVLLDLLGGDLEPGLVERVAQAAPDARIVVLSGWAGALDTTHVTARLDKNVDFDVLADTLRKAGKRSALNE